MNTVDRDELLYKTCLLLVQHYKNLVEHHKNSRERIGYHSRLFQHILHPEEAFCYLGRSEKVDLKDNLQNSRPEHVVPCSYMIKQLDRLIIEGKYSDKVLAEALQKNWKIARITHEEARKLDFELKLKNEMPEGWDFMTGDPKARLEQAGIKLV